MFQSLFVPPIFSNSKEPHFDYNANLTNHYSTLASHYFSQDSRLVAQAQNLQTLSIYLREPSSTDSSMSDIVHMCFGSFKSLGKLCFCSPSKWTTLYQLEDAVMAAHYFCTLDHGGMCTPKYKISERFECRHEILGFDWVMKDGQSIKVEFVVYYW
jgi:hypothetical protein